MNNIRFDQFLNTAPPTIIVQPDAPVFSIVTANEAYLQATGTVLPNLVGVGFLEAFPENPSSLGRGNEAGLLMKSLMAAVRTKEKTVMDGHRYDIRDNVTGKWQTRYWINTNSPILNEEGEIEYIVHVTHDITSAYQSAQKEKIAFDVTEAQRKQLHLAYMQAPVGIGLLSGRNMMIEFGNENMLRVLGKTEAIVGKPLSEAMPELHAQTFLQILDNVYTTGETFYGNNMPASFEVNGVLQNGYYNFIYHPLKDANGSTTGIMIVGVDVTEQVTTQKQLEQNVEQKNLITDALRANEARLQGILDTMAEGVIIYDATGALQYVNAMAIEISSLSKEDFSNREYNDDKWQNLRPDGSLLPREEHPLFIVLSTKKPVYNYELYLSLTNGVKKYLSVNATPFYNGDKSFGGCIATFTDITRRRRLMNQLAESESRFRGIFEQAPLGMCMLRGREQIIEAVNENILSIWGRTREEVINLPQCIARPELQGQSVLEWLDDVFVTGKTRVNTDFKVYLNNPEGGVKEVIVNSVYQPITDANGEVTGVLMITDEITEQYGERQQGLHTQEMFALAVASVDLGTWYYDIVTQQFTASERTKEIYGITNHQPLRLETAFAQIPDDYRSKVKRNIFRAYYKSENYDLEFPITDIETGQLRWVKSTGKIYHSANGESGQFSGTLLDITERKLDEIRKNDFIAMVSHELKTPLTSMKASLQTIPLVSRIDDEVSSQLLKKAEQQINKMTNLINSFLNVSRLDAGKIHLEKSGFYIDELIEEVIEDMTSITKDHIVSFSPRKKLFIYADYEKIGQVVNNFISNAVKYSGKDTRIDISCAQHKQEVQVSVKDEGRGIPERDKEHLFDRFYRVEHKDNATISGFGIGLYLCAEIIQRQGGKIWVESKEGKGSIFYFSIPYGEGNQ